MKLSEIREKMFSLSDLKGLIGESMDEGKYDKFFEQYPQFKDPSITYQNSEELRKALHDFFGDKYPDPNLYPTLKNIERKGYNKRFQNGRGYIPASDREISMPADNVGTYDSFVQSSDSIPSVKKTENNTPVNVLYDAFLSSGGENIKPDDPNYLNDINNIANTIGEGYGKIIRRFNEKQFTQNPNIKVGDENDPFALFLLFYYVRFCTKNGAGVTSRTEEFLNNISSEQLKEKIGDLLGLNPHNSVKSIESALNEIGLTFDSPLTNESLGLLVNRYFNWRNLDQMYNDMVSLVKSRYVDTLNISMIKSNGTVGNVLLGALYIIKCSPKTVDSFWDNLNVTDLKGDSLSPVRAGAYFVKYRMMNPETLKTDSLVSISECFNIPIVALFDPTVKINEEVIRNGVKTWATTYSEQVSPLRSLNLPVISEKAQNMAPIERIFTIGRALNSLLEEKSFKRFGASGRNVLDRPDMAITDKIDLFLSDANEGLKLLEADVEKRGVSIPQPISRLRTIYQSNSGTNGRGMEFWQLLARGSNTKTQDEIYYYLSSISDPGVVWIQEYNRYQSEDTERVEGGLGGKSIDILGRTSATKRNAKTLCFEYQGEQHYRPINVKPVDYQYTLYTEMRNAVLKRCGFYSIKGRDGRIYYWADKDMSSDSISPEAKNVIINVYAEYIEKLKDILREREEIGDNVISKNFNVMSEGVSIRSGINPEALKTFTIKEALKYFETVVERGAEDSDMFDELPLNGMVPYLCSPCRFADEITTAVDLARDRIKSQTVLARRKYGWEMAYVTPKISKTFTDDDFRYTVEELAQNNDQIVFTWDNEGKKKISDYLVVMGFKTGPETKNETLFEQIVREIIGDNIL